MKVLQGSPSAADEIIEQARTLGCDGIAWDLREPCESAVEGAAKAGLRNEGWLQVARDEAAASEHPKWMHCPQHHEWLQRFPDFTGRHPALVAPYLGLNTKFAFMWALGRTTALIRENPWAHRVWLADIQGPPMGCGCGNPSCRSWDNAPGDKLAVTPYEHPEMLFPLEFYRALSASLGDTKPDLVPVLCPECERGISMDGVDDPDGPHGTDLCMGIPCVRPCALDYWPGLLKAFRGEEVSVGLLLMTEALGKDHPVYGEPRAWAKRAHAHYGNDLIPCIEPEDAGLFESGLILTHAPQDCWPVEPPPGYEPALPPIMCGYCPPNSESG
jgi:hypothetical protein